MCISHYPLVSVDSGSIPLGATLFLLLLFFFLPQLDFSKPGLGLNPGKPTFFSLFLFYLFSFHFLFSFSFFSFSTFFLLFSSPFPLPFFILLIFPFFLFFPFFAFPPLPPSLFPSFFFPPLYLFILTYSSPFSFVFSLSFLFFLLASSLLKLALVSDINPSIIL